MNPHGSQVKMLWGKVQALFSHVPFTSTFGQVPVEVMREETEGKKEPRSSYFILACGTGESGRTRIRLIDLRKTNVWFSNIEVAGA